MTTSKEIRDEVIKALLIIMRTPNLSNSVPAAHLLMEIAAELRDEEAEVGGE